MAGRFLTVVVLMSVCLIARHPGLTATRTAVAFAVPIALALFLSKGAESWPSSKDFNIDGIADERRVYRNHASLMLSRRNHRLPSHPWIASGKDLAKKDVKVKIVGPAGYLGFSAGPKVHLVDYWGLVDPLLARLPVDRPKNFRIGHFTRKVPKGYTKTLRTGQCRMNEAYCKYYNELERIVRGPIWSWKRFVSIVKMNFGAYDHWLKTARKPTAPPAAR